MKRKIRIKNKKKFIRSMSILIFLVLGIFMGVTNSYSNEEIKYKTKIIYQGDTLWSIAEKEEKNNDYFKDKDIRNIIQEIKIINDLKTSSLMQGQEIKIPTY